MFACPAETMLLPLESLRRHDRQYGQIVRDVVGAEERRVDTRPLVVVELHLHLCRRKVRTVLRVDDVVGRGDVESSAALAYDEAEAVFSMV